MTTRTLEDTRAARLKGATHATHDRLDRSIMEAAFFASLDGYIRFATMQHGFHRDIDALYDVPRLRVLLPGLDGRRRLALIAADLHDLKVPLPRAEAPPVFLPDAEPDVPTALGWLYVAEGSNMGAALLRKEAARLGMSDTHGARHLAPAPEGPAAHWRAFTAALNAVELSEGEEARTIAGANAAFARVQALADASFA
ncbi:biliverdin-producing heme oxygenase [Novosphingobium sp. ST904]|uniref:biliverdin-producing heme oxygenase n=2 Tax=Novosphingobium sp. ST904 TaxID=1684385 RepID=UPI00104CEE01|nr:biliverdin-producing heme oxygenase [Novosphingobium sp. ST904]TCM38743.1 heme oxygenase [Novosphingobium sp. ST904]